MIPIRTGSRVWIMGNEADRVVRARKKALDDARAADGARAELDIRAAQRRIMAQIETEIPQALDRLAAKNYPHSAIHHVPVRRGIGPFKSSKVTYVEKASWTVLFLHLPGKESPDRARFVLISDGYVLPPYAYRLSQQEIDKDWQGYKKYPDIVGPNPWPGEYAPGILAKVLEGLQRLPYDTCRHCGHAIIRQDDGIWCHHQFGFQRSCHNASNDRHSTYDNDLDRFWAAEPIDE
jgi:hypothetical protein